MNKPLFWEIVRPEYIITGHLLQNIMSDLRVADLKLQLYADGKWFSVQMPVNTTLSQWLIDDYKESRAKRGSDDDYAESFREAK